MAPGEVRQGIWRLSAVAAALWSLPPGFSGGVMATTGVEEWMFFLFKANAMDLNAGFQVIILQVVVSDMFYFHPY